jgi:hypothetical protein
MVMCAILIIQGYRTRDLLLRVQILEAREVLARANVGRSPTE